MFGRGNEPATLEEFYKYYLINSYKYNIGQLVSSNPHRIETTGFNQWDEEVEFGTISSEGILNTNTTNLRTKNFIGLVLNENYYFKSPYGCYIRCYDKDKVYLGVYQSNSEGWVYPNNLIESSKLCPETRFIKFYLTSTYGKTYMNDICINLHHTGYRNGEYESHKEYYRELPEVTKIIDPSTGEALFPDGLRSAGNIYDEITSTHAIKRVGVIEDLGSLSWSRGTTAITDKYRFSSSLNAFDGVSTATSTNNVDVDISNGICTFLPIIPVGNTYNNMDGIAIHENRLYLYSSNYSNSSYTAETIKTTLSGHKLYYELKTPIVVELDEPFNMDYSVWDFGTERIVPAVIPSSSFRADITYGFNAVDTVRNNKIGVDEFKAFMDKMKAGLGVSSYDEVAERMISLFGSIPTVTYEE